MSKKIENILLVYPKIPKNTYWSLSYALKFVKKKSAMPPLGLITIASMLKGYRLKLIDENVEKLKDKHLRWADMIFTSSMVVQKTGLRDVILRANRFNIPVVSGGPHPTQFYDQIKGVAHFILGEAESGALAQFLHDLRSGNPKKAYAKMTLRKSPKGHEIDEESFKKIKEYFGDSGDIKEIKERPSMDLSPIPKYSLLRINKYSSMGVQFSRGCPFNCEFCNEPSLFGHIPRLKSTEKFLKELNVLYKMGYKGSIFIVDDNFIGNIKGVKGVLPAIEEFQRARNYPFKFYTEASLNLSQDEALMTSMRNAGFNMVFVGIESPDKEVLKNTGKYINAQQDQLEAVRKIQKHGMEVTAGIIVGMDKEPVNICEQIFEFSQKAGIPNTMAGLLTPEVGSELYLRLKKEKRLLHTKSSGNNTHHLELSYLPDGGRIREEVIKSYKKLLSRLYDHNGKNYFKRCKTLLDNIVPGPKFARNVRIKEIQMLLRSLTFQSCQRYGKEYLKFLWYSFTKKTKVFPEAVKLAIIGHHFMKITKKAIK